MKCDLNPSLLDGLVDNSLNKRERQQVFGHVAECDHCQQALAGKQMVKSHLKAMTPPPLSANFEQGLQAKLAALDTQPAPAVNSNVTPLPDSVTPANNTPVLRWAMAASVMLSVFALSWFNAPMNNGTEQLALDTDSPIIEIHAPMLSDDVDALRLADQMGVEDEYWGEQQMTQFDHYTQVDDAFTGFQCGGTVGEQACTLGPGVIATALPLTNAL